MAKESLVIYWSRRDFRLEDNRALSGACSESAERSTPLVPLFIFEDYMCEGSPGQQFGYPSRLFLSEALPKFSKQFPFFLVVRGKAAHSIKKLSEVYDISVHVNEDVFPDFYTQIRKLREASISVKVYADMLTVPKDTVTGSGGVYSIFTPFKNTVREKFVSIAPQPRVVLKSIHIPTEAQQEHLESIFSTIELRPENLRGIFSTNQTFNAGGRTYDMAELLPERNAGHVLAGWYASEEEVLERFKTYLLSGGMDAYATGRDSLTLDAGGSGATSRMSLALAWGLVSARMLVSRIQEHYGDSFTHPLIGERYTGVEHYISELIWREFYTYLLFHRPELLDTEFQTKFQGTIAWVPEEEAHARFTAWIQGHTGYPIVDAAMMQLAQTGWMHNRSRMIVASVLTKNLGVDWRWGQEYFRAALLDLYDASNNGGWQWGASVGADPKPIRIFNPELQAKTHDADKAYQNKWLSEEYRTNPPAPIVPHSEARAEALKRYGLSHTKPRDF